jgi:beta-glucanase (GH16 family)
VIASPPAVAAATAVTPAPPGWKLVSSDDFTGSALGSQWGSYGGSYAIGANAWSPDDVSVSGGLLHVRMERRTTAGKPFTSGGAAMWGFAQTYGRHEFEAQAPTTPGIDSYITLWPPDSDSDADATLVELLAKPAVAPGQEAAYVTIGYGGGKKYATVPGHYTDRFHDYVIEWTPDHESASVDGTVLLRSTQVTKARRWIGFIMSNGDNLTGTPAASDSLPAEFLVGSLRVYAYVPGNDTPSSSSRPPTSSPARPPAPGSVTTHPASSSSSSQSSPTSTAPSPPTTARSDSASAGTSATGFPMVPAASAAVVGLAAAAGLFLRRRQRARPRPSSHRRG